jgi:hypothetical protein
MEQWLFFQQPDGGWHWRHTNGFGASRESALGFRNRADCVANAIYHGYVPAVTRPARDPDPGLGDALAA